MILKYHDVEEFIVFMLTNAALIATIFVPSIIMGLSVASVLISLIITSITFYFLVIFVLSKHNVHFSFIEEGTAKRVYRGGRFVFAILVYFQHSLTKSFKVIDDTEMYTGKEEIIKETWLEQFFTRWFGVHYIGLWPLYRIPYRKFTWTSTNQKTEEDETRTENQDYILVRPDLYSSTLKKAEDKNNVPITWNFSAVLGIVDIGTATKVQNPYQVVMAMIWNYLKDETGSQSFNDLVTGANYPLIQVLNDKNVEDKFRKSVSKRMMEDWGREGGMLDDMVKFCGVRLFKFNIKNMDPDDKYRKLTTQKIVAKTGLTVQKIKARGEAFTLGQQIAGAAMNMLAISSGVLVEDLEKIKKDTPEEFKKNYGEEYKENIATVMTVRSIDARVFSEFKTNASGDIGGIITAIAAGNMIAGRSNQSGSNNPSQNTPSKEKDRKNKLFRDAGFEAFVHENDDE